jgi:hypothetical protein
MAFTSVTNTFVNGQSADAGEVNTNFTDLVNGLSDGTKSLNMDVGTFAGAVTMNGDVTLGNGSGDDITITGSIAADIAIKSTFVVDLGSSTVGMSSIYFGADDASANTVRVMGGTMSSSYTLTLPEDGGNSGEILQTDGSGVTSWVTGRDINNVVNLSIDPTVAGSALTVTIKSADGTSLSATNSGTIVFGSVTSSVLDGKTTEVSLTSDITVDAASGATAGFASGSTRYLYIYAINNGGTAEAAWCGVQLNEGTVHTTVAEDTASDTSSSLYSTTLRSNVAIRLLGRIKFSLTTAGTWDESGDEVSLIPLPKDSIIAKYTGCTTSIPTGLSTSTVAYAPTKGIDTHDAYSLGVFTCPKAGKYRVSYDLHVNATAAAAGNAFAIEIYKNSSGDGPRYLTAYLTTGIERHLSMSSIIDCAATNTLSVKAGQNFNGGANVSFSDPATLMFEYLGE